MNNYTFTDAFWEIFFIVIISFIFGWIARWLWDEYFADTKYEEEVLYLDEKGEILKNEEKKETLPLSLKETEIEEKVEKSNLNLTTNKISPTGFKFDDLKIVEGIGPKIEMILKKNNIENWKDLAEKTPAELKEILKNAGDRYSFHNPESWPEQAMLAAEARWEELEEFQEFLIGGRVKIKTS